MQTPLALTIIGLAIVIVTVAILIRGRTSPVIVMTLVPVVGALCAGFGFEAIAEFFGDGLSSVMNVVVMFIFAIIYFGVLSDVGLFTPVIKALIKATRGNVVLVAVGTAAIGIVAHLDGAGATTFLLTIPALLPLYKALHMSRYVLLAIVAIAASVMNMVPWGGPLGRASSVIEQDPIALWQHLLPIQGIAVVMIFGIAALLGLKEQRRIAQLRTTSEFVGSGSVDVNEIADDFERRQNKEREKDGIKHRQGTGITVFNIALSILLLVIMMSGWLPPAPAFLIGTTLLLLVNFKTSSDQADIMKRHAPNALSMASVIIAAAMFLGVLNGAGMLEQIAMSLLAVLPESVGPWLHVIVGLLGVPLDLATSTDAYYFSILPIVQETTAAFGVTGTGAATALIIGNIIGTFVSPFSPALWLAIGLAEANMGKHIKFTFPIAWLFSVVLLLIALATGLLV
ncbi:CitMHS family transporter [Corynebacterium cystitidis]|uniref:Citrate-Mg2+:H+ or citrate-Ca2+:H+ symporter, CitMHS family n=1 Tax=Corynebacterium cystitidis DSM 20524 TaxID=1121357 RepID=A0A1H9TXC9_9CORY|nr:citrate:proton symporter [Corynebacterium cystitidis]WJY81906.1 Citrate transporter [Corynebacterium cystitidis DSM 20524]SES01776.1 citrate-Mg2+:H+ or citrate-Ca2+:H+ symporter, CitMHS family [Corynebacterium cystitidis DSM 20524]SNV82212.1 transporter [Corynebacterium cystitidis]